MRFILLAGLVLLSPIAEAAAPPAGAILALREGLRLKNEKRLSDAILKFEQATKLAPDYAEAWAELGNAHLAKQAFGPASKAFGRALQVKSDYAVARYNYAFSLRKLKKYKPAAEQYRLYIQQKPGDADAHYGLAEALRAAGDKLAAADAYESYARTEKNPAQAKWVAKAKETAAQLRGEAQATQKLVEPAVPVPKKKTPKKKLPQKKPPKAVAKKKSSDDEVVLSFSEGGAGAATEASTDASMDAELDKDVSMASPRPKAFDAGINHLQNGDYDAALVRLQTAIREKPNDALILAALAGAHLGRREGEQAELLYQRAIPVAAPEALPGLYLGLGEAQRIQEKNDAARGSYQRVLDHAEATNSLKRFSRERMASLE